MKKIVRTFLDLLHCAVVLIGIIAGAFLAMFILAVFIFIFGEPHDGNPGDLLRLGLYLVNKAPLLGILLFFMAIYAMMEIEKLVSTDDSKPPPPNSFRENRKG